MEQPQLVYAMLLCTFFDSEKVMRLETERYPFFTILKKLHWGKNARMNTTEKTSSLHVSIVKGLNIYTAKAP